MDVNFLYVTTGNLEEARSIAKTMVQERLAACANILPTMHSVYEWEGSLQEDTESVLILKTTASLTSRAVERVTELHSYTVPCVCVFPVSGGHTPFLEWVHQETLPKKPQS